MVLVKHSLVVNGNSVCTTEIDTGETILKIHNSHCNDVHLLTASLKGGWFPFLAFEVEAK